MIGDKRQGCARRGRKKGKAAPTKEVRGAQAPVTEGSYVIGLHSKAGHSRHPAIASLAVDLAFKIDVLGR